MKILYYSSIFLRANNGPSIHVLSVCKELGKCGHRVVLFSYPFDKEMNSKDFISIQIPQWPGRFVRLATLKSFFWRLCGYLVTLLFRPDVIYQRDHMDNYPLSLARRMGVPLAIEMNGWMPADRAFSVGADEYQMTIDAIRERYQLAAAFIVSSPGVRDLLLTQFNLQKAIVKYVNNGADIERLSPPMPYHRQSTRMVIGYVCGSHPGLDVETILNALSLIRDSVSFEFRLITDAPNIQSWIDLSKNLGIDRCLTVLKNISQNQLQHQLWEIDLGLAIYTRTVIQKIKSLEGAMKLWDYWASQRPVIATDLPWTESYHHHLEKRYLAVEPENPVALAGAIRQLNDSPALAEELAYNGYEYAQQGHTWADTAREIEDVLQKAIRRD